MEHIRDHVKVAATMGVFLHAVECGELAKSLAKATARKDSKQTKIQNAVRSLFNKP